MLQPSGLTVDREAAVADSIADTLLQSTLVDTIDSVLDIKRQKQSSITSQTPSGDVVFAEKLPGSPVLSPSAGVTFSPADTQVSLSNS